MRLSCMFSKYNQTFVENSDLSYPICIERCHWQW